MPMLEVLEHPVHFGGGIRLARPHHRLLSRSLRSVPLPEQLILPLKQHQGPAAEAIVQIGERVGKGQCIARQTGYISAPVHASSSGTVVAIEDRPVAGAATSRALCICIATDGQDEWFAPRSRCPDYRQLRPDTIQQRILEAGIVGMGGAGFPTAVKLAPGRDEDIDILLLNATECEPYLGCDEAVLEHWPERIITGLNILRHTVQPRRVVLAIADDRSEAVMALQRLVAAADDATIQILSVPSYYPIGGERQLIKSITGKTVPDGALPIDMQILLYNVGTVLAIHDAIVLGQPSLRRIVSVTGPGIARPGNFDVLIGTPISKVLEACGGLPPHTRLVVGGPMMGHALRDLEAPVVKTSNGLLALEQAENTAEPERACIRCGECAVVCPETLSPHELLRHAREENWRALQDEDLFACIECGCCSYVCPSRIPLVDIYLKAKSDIWQVLRQQQEADAARARYKAKQRRAARATPPASDTLPDHDTLRAEVAAAVQRRQAAGKDKASALICHGPSGPAGAATEEP